jgi:hypothetical protein
LAAKAPDSGDRVLAKSVAERLIHALRMQAKRGKIAIAGKDKGAIVWSAPVSFAILLGFTEP